MRNLVLILFFVSAYPQDKSSLEYQVDEWKRTVEYLKAGDTIGATISARFAMNWDDKTEIGIQAKKIYEQLFPSSQLILKREIQGTWSLFKTGSNWGYTTTLLDEIEKIVVIDDTYFSFYDVDKKTNEKTLTKKEKIRFSEYENSLGFKMDYVFSDNTIWSFRVDENKKVLKQTNTGMEISSSRTEMVCGNEELHYFRK